MKKLIIACAAVLVLGLGLTTVGHVLGGQFYSVYYNGALHPRVRRQRQMCIRDR